MIELPKRPGPRPRTTPTNPHTQLDQNPGPEMVAKLAHAAFSLAGVEERDSLISVPGARALWLREDERAGPDEAFIIGREFAHIHPLPDGSLHMVLPVALAEEAVRQGWAEPHPMARLGHVPENVVMVYGPRDDGELEVVKALLYASFRAATAREDSSA